MSIIKNFLQQSSLTLLTRSHLFMNSVNFLLNLSLVAPLYFSKPFSYALKKFVMILLLFSSLAVDTHYMVVLGNDWFNFDKFNRPLVFYCSLRQPYHRLHLLLRCLSAQGLTKNFLLGQYFSESRQLRRISCSPRIHQGCEVDRIIGFLF